MEAGKTEQIYHAQITRFAASDYKQPPELFHERKVFLKISQDSQENTCVGVSFLLKLQA